MADIDAKAKGERLLKNTGVRTFELLAYVSGYLEGTIDDWPALVQDALAAALERKAQEVQLPLTVVHSFCDKDLDSTDPKRVWFVRVFASEVVAVDVGGTRH